MIVRINNCVYQVLKIEVLHTILVECVCHSIRHHPSAVTAGCLFGVYCQRNLQVAFAVVNLLGLLL